MKNLFLILLYMLALASPAAVFAATADLPKIDGSTDDVEKTGVSWPNPRFTDQLDGTVIDHLTGLMWMKEANCIANVHGNFDVDGYTSDGRVTWQHALDFVALVNDVTPTANQCNVLTTYTDWRLPNRREIWSLLDFSVASDDLPSGISVLPEGNPFIGSESVYWSSTSDAHYPNYAWSVYLDYAYATSYEKQNTYYVWLVRGGQ